MGEGIGNDAELMPYISSANIACGFHAGDEQIMADVMKLAITHGVSIGAHISFPDRKNFGRTEMNVSAHEVYELIQEQIWLAIRIANEHDTIVKHVKPHGALYNMSARDASLAKTIAQAVADVDQQLVLVGLSGSVSISEAQRVGLKTASEVFADRRYEEDGSLRSRSLPDAMIEDLNASRQQVLQMVMQQQVTALSGKLVNVSADTICIHGDGAHAVEFAKGIHQILKQHSFAIKAL